jgi:hypothetical protein
MNKDGGTAMADQLGRFGMAIAVIALIASGLYQFSGSVSVATSPQGVAFHPLNWRPQ